MATLWIGGTAAAPRLSKTIDEHLRLSKSYSTAADVDGYCGIRTWGVKRIIMAGVEFSLPAELFTTSKSSLTLIFLSLISTFNY